MNSKSSSSRLVNAGIILAFFVAALIGSALLGVAVWGDVEASMFDLMYRGEEKLDTLACPILITPQDSGELTARIKNPTDALIRPAVRVHITSGALTFKEEENIKFELAPAESRKLSWTVSPENAVYGQMVLVKVFLFPDNPIPSKDATCGILVIDLPQVSGKLLVYGGMAVSFMGMIAATVGWQHTNRLMTKRQRETFRAMCILAGVIILGLFASLFGNWLIGGLAIVVTILLTAGTIFSMI